MREYLVDDVRHGRGKYEWNSQVRRAARPWVHAFSEPMQGFHPQLDGFLVGNSTSLPSHTPAHLSLSLVPICARKPWYLHDALVHIPLPPAIPCFFPALPISLILCTTVSTSYCLPHPSSTQPTLSLEDRPNSAQQLSATRMHP